MRDLPNDSQSVRNAAERYRRAEDDLGKAREYLYHLIREDRRAGVSLRTLADLTGLSFARIAQIEKSG